ncbi:MAG TPA: ATP-binding protein [Solirubrobacterales bacterium]|jgi:DNA replication protein DnaC|nr:ATP-binding protein [Solirubrobacterales bacterium]
MPAIARSEPFRGQGPCPLGVCDGSGWILGPEDVARPCDCREQRLKRGRNRGVASVIPRKFQGVSFDRPPVTEIDPMVVRVVRSWIEDMEANLANGRGLWLMGDTGTGKTTLAMLVSKAALQDNRSVAIYSLPKLLARIRRTYDSEPGGDSYLSFFERLTSVDLLHIDDLGAEKRSDWVLEQLYALVNERYEAQRSILVTTNLDQQQLEEQIGSRTVSRLVEICGDPLPLFGADQRVQARAVGE